MATKKRFQNPAVNDTVELDMFVYNSNNLTDFESIEKVEIYYLDPEEVSAENPNGERLVQSLDGSLVTRNDVGSYTISLDLTSPLYVIGKYYDVWHVVAVNDQPNQTVANCFQVYPNLWYTNPMPVVYDFNFHFQPNRLRLGSKQYLIIEIIPNVPTASELQRYYENLAISSDLKITIQQN
jgi:hypothetical protein